MKIQNARRHSFIFIFGALAILILLALLILVAPNSKFGGSDNAGANTIHQIAPQYDSTWTNNWWKPAPETESMLFALQAAIGGLAIGYGLGYLRGRKSTLPQSGNSDSTQL